MRLLLLIFLAGMLAAAQSQTNSPLNSPPSTNLATVQPLWKLDIQRNEPAKDSLSPRVVSDEERIFYLQAGQVKAVDAETGQQLWTFRVGKGAQLKYTLGSLLAITEQGKVWALEPQTGRVRWSRMGAGIIYTIDDKSLYIAEEQKLLALDLETGETKWLTRESFFNAWEPFTAIKNRIFVYVVNGDAIFAETYIYDARTGKRLGEADTRNLLAVLNQRVYFQNDWFLAGHPDNAHVNVYDLQTGKLLEKRTYSIENRVKGSNWSIEMAVSNAVYISGGGNLACFPLSAPGGKAKPNFIRVPRGDVQWLAGPRNGTFLLEWQGALWLVRQDAKDSCAPIALLEQGQKVASGKLARYDVAGNGLYLGLKNGMFHAINLRTGETVLRLKLTAPIGPTHVVGYTLIIQAGDDLLAFALPQELKP